MNTLIEPSLERYIDENTKQRVKYIVNIKKTYSKSSLTLFTYLRTQITIHLNKGRANNQIKKFENNRLNRRHKQGKLKEANKT